MTDQPQDAEAAPDGAGMSRRQALLRLGLGAAVAYSAPVVLPLNEEALARGPRPPRPGPPRPSWAKPTKPGSKPTKPSKPKKKKKKK